MQTPFGHDLMQDFSENNNNNNNIFISNITYMQCIYMHCQCRTFLDTAHLNRVYLKDDNTTTGTSFSAVRSRSRFDAGQN